MIKNIGKAKYGKQDGFTLVELLVVISIIAILSVVSVAGYTQFIGKAKESNCVNELTQLRDMLKAADEDDNDYFIFDDEGKIYKGTAKSKGVLDDDGIVDLQEKYFPDMLTSVDGETRELKITTVAADATDSTKGEKGTKAGSNKVVFTWTKDGKTITTTWYVDTDLVEAVTADEVTTPAV